MEELENLMLVINFNKCIEYLNIFCIFVPHIIKNKKWISQLNYQTTVK